MTTKTDQSAAISRGTFRAKWTRICEQHEARQEEVDAYPGRESVKFLLQQKADRYLDEEAAKLFFQSNESLTQETMAEATGKTQRWVSRILARREYQEALERARSD